MVKRHIQTIWQKERIYTHAEGASSIKPDARKEDRNSDLTKSELLRHEIDASSHATSKASVYSTVGFGKVTPLSKFKVFTSQLPISTNFHFPLQSISDENLLSAYLAFRHT
jgi:hypothetical protein